MSALVSILMPALESVRSKALFVQGMNDFRQIGYELNVVANDHKDHFPPSVATNSYTGGWTWASPRYMVNRGARSSAYRKSMSAYLGNYISDASVFSCPAAPDDFSYLQEMWDAGENWDYPGMAGDDVFSGNYAFYWNYEGIIQGADGQRKRFKGPQGPGSSRKYSKLLISDYLGYGGGLDEPPPCRFASCDGFKGALVQKEKHIAASYWIGELNATPEDIPVIKLKALYTDGRVETYDSRDTVILDVIKDRKTLETYGQGSLTTPGWFFLPEGALH
jgi:hypothetical protein